MVTLMCELACPESPSNRKLDEPRCCSTIGSAALALHLAKAWGLLCLALVISGCCSEGLINSDFREVHSQDDVMRDDFNISNDQVAIEIGEVETLISCNDVEYSCSEPWSRSPTPYDSCSGIPFYWTCPNDQCRPLSGPLSIFFQAWLDYAPSLLGVPLDQFRNHVFLNKLSELQWRDGSYEYRAYFLVVFDWVISRGVLKARLSPGSPVDLNAFASALDSDAANHFQGLPSSVIARDDALACFAPCGNDFVLNYCAMRYSAFSTDALPGFWLQGTRILDALSGSGVLAECNLVTGEVDCERYYFNE